MANQLIIPSSSESVQLLTQSVATVADLFYNWNQRSGGIRIPKYKKEITSLTKHLDTTCQAYEAAVDQAAEDARIGANVAGEVVDLIQQLMKPKRRIETIPVLREDLLKSIGRALEAAKELSGDFKKVQRDLLLAKERVPELQNDIKEYGAATVSTDAKLLAAVVTVTSILFPPMLSKAKELRDAANANLRKSSTQAALEVMQDIGPRVDSAIEAVGTLIDFWSQLYAAIDSTTPHELLKMNGAVLERSKQRWCEIGSQYKTYAGAASSSRAKLDMKRTYKAIKNR